LGRLSIAIVAALLLMPVGAAHAAVFNVVSTNDSPDGSPGNGLCQSIGAVPGPCTLRAAVMEANELPGADTINLPAGDYQLTGAADEDAAVTGDLDIDLPDNGNAQSLTIAGAGARTTRIIGTGSDRVFHVQSSELTTSMSGVTITGGGGVGQGGGIFAAGLLNLTDATVSGNRVDDPAFISNQGGGIFNLDQMNLRNVTISGNVGERGLQSSFGPQGGGLFDNGSPTSTLVNVTISGNELTGSGSQGGGMFYNADSLSTTLTNVTIAGNTAPTDVDGAGIFVNDELTFVNTLVALNRTTAGTVSNCFDNGTVISSGHNLEEGTDCNFVAAGDIRNSNPLLGPLQDNGGPTDTHALPAGSPAIDAGDGSACPATDQRGTTRPQLAGCDIGAFELDGPSDATPPDTTIISGPTGLIRGRTATFTFASTEPGASFECSLDGGPFFACTSPFTTPPLPGGLHTFQVRARDAAGNVDPTPTSFAFRIALRLADLARPVLGRRVNVEPIGFVRWAPRLTGARADATASQKGLRFRPLQQARQIPVGSFLDTRRGSIRLQSARNRRGATQRGTFSSGVFQVLQSRKRRARGLTELRLKGSSFRRCRTGRRGRRGSASAAQLSRRTVRRLRANARGRFRTRGRHSAATVRGTVWITADRCDGTLTKVRRGRVAVRDIRRKRTVVVRAGKRYLARARG